jgi:hypothetical protein
VKYFLRYYAFLAVLGAVSAAVFIVTLTTVALPVRAQKEMSVATRNAANTADVPALSEETKVKLLLAQHDFDQTQIRYAQVQQQCQQQGTQINTEAGKEFQALEALKESAYTEANADKSAWTLTDKMEFAPAPKRPAPPEPTPAAKP